MTGEGGHDGGGAAPVLGHPAAARDETGEGMHAKRGEGEAIGVQEQVRDHARVAPGVQVLVVGGEVGALEVLEVEGLGALAIDAGQEIEVVGMDGAAAQLTHPVPLELLEPSEPEIGVDETPVQARLDLRPQRVKGGEAPQAAERAQPVAAPRLPVGGGELRLLVFEERSYVRTEIVVEVHAATGRGPRTRGRGRLRSTRMRRRPARSRPWPRRSPARRRPAIPRLRGTSCRSMVFKILE